MNISGFSRCSATSMCVRECECFACLTSLSLTLNAKEVCHILAGGCFITLPGMVSNVSTSESGVIFVSCVKIQKVLRHMVQERWKSACKERKLDQKTPAAGVSFQPPSPFSKQQKQKQRKEKCRTGVESMSVSGTCCQTLWCCPACWSLLSLWLLFLILKKLSGSTRTGPQFLKD